LQVNRDIIQINDSLPSEDSVFVRVEIKRLRVLESLLLDINNPPPSVFSNTPRTSDNLSCDWDHYVTAQESWKNISKIRNEQANSYKDCSKFAVYSFNVSDLINIEEVKSVLYTPLVENIAHSQIFKDLAEESEARKKMAIISSISHPNMDGKDLLIFGIRNELNKEKEKLENLNRIERPNAKQCEKIKKCESRVLSLQETMSSQESKKKSNMDEMVLKNRT